MGFNNWNAFGCDVNEALIKETAAALVSSGLKDAGYVHVNIDDCWSLRERDPTGRLVADPAKFPGGMKALADHVHGLGLKLGIYGDAGTKTCAGFPGSLGKEQLDADTWASWGIDYLKYDNCSNQSDGSRADYVRRYTAMRRAIDATRRPIVYSICEWGQSQPWEWAAGVGQLWRTTGDISDDWPSLRGIIASNARLAQYAGPGHWNDPDMLEIGNGGMTLTEYRTHMSLWAMMAAPLITGADLRKISQEALAILKNRELIAIDQDPLGKQARVVAEDAGLLAFAKPLVGGDVAVALYNSTDVAAIVQVSAAQAGLPSAPAYRVKDVWSELLLHAGSVLAAGVPAHGTVVYRVSPLKDAGGLPTLLGVSGELPALTPSVPGGATLSATVTNYGIVDVDAVALRLDVPVGWSATAQGANESERLAAGASLTRRWTITAPPSAPRGQEKLLLKAEYGSKAPSQRAAATTELSATVVAPPPLGVIDVGELTAARATSAQGPVEHDMASGGPAEGDGNLLTLQGQVFTRGLGTRAPSELVYYLGGRCSEFSAQVGLDDSLSTSGAASFTVFADGRVAAQTGAVRQQDGARLLTANVNRVQWLRLVTEVVDTHDGAGLATDWASPKLSCGPEGIRYKPRRALFSFEAPIADFAVKGSGGSFAQSATFKTDGHWGLQVTAGPDGNWFGKSFDALDMSYQTRLAFDIKTDSTGTPGELAVEMGPNKTWCQGGRWAWTNAGSTKTIKTSFKDLSCPGGVKVDQARITGVWVFVKGGTFVIDQVRAE
jgi:alpha-galactosidase